jgi:hypothetical protein
MQRIQLRIECGSVAAVYTLLKFNSWVSFINRCGELCEHDALGIEGIVIDDEDGTEWNYNSTSRTGNR